MSCCFHVPYTSFRFYLGIELHQRNYRYLINPSQNTCSEPLFLLVIVESTLTNAMERDYFRQRWKREQHRGHQIRTVFSIAQTDLKGSQELLELEQRRY